MKVQLIAHTTTPEAIIAAAAKNCYSNQEISKLMDNLTPENIDSFIDRLSELGHESPFEHVSFTFAIEGVSRSLLAQITRHRIASFSVQSQRYVDMKGNDIVIPPEIEKRPEALTLFNNTMHEISEAYDKLTELLENAYYDEMREGGRYDLADRMKNSFHKKAIEDARYILPNASCTKIVMTINTRSLYNFFKLRCCNRAQWEIRELAEAMFSLCYKATPKLFEKAGPSCTYGPCTEGKMTCGESSMVREKYVIMKNKA